MKVVDSLLRLHHVFFSQLTWASARGNPLNQTNRGSLRPTACLLCMLERPPLVWNDNSDVLLRLPIELFQIHTQGLKYLQCCSLFSSSKASPGAALQLMGEIWTNRWSWHAAVNVPQSWRRDLFVCFMEFDFFSVFRGDDVGGWFETLNTVSW